MVRRLLLALAVLLLLAVAVVGRMVWGLLHPAQQDLPLPDSLIALSTDEGQRLLSEGVVADFRALDAAFQPQQHGSYCGVASSVIALSALGIPTSQDDFFTAQASAVRRQHQVLLGGMSLPQLGGLLSAHGVSAAVHHATDGGLPAFRQQATANLSRSGDVVLINYHRPALAQEGGGHISPLAGYHAASDRFLVLDTASYRYPPVWVDAEALWAAMNTTDSASAQTRGYVLVSREAEDSP